LALKNEGFRNRVTTGPAVVDESRKCSVRGIEISTGWSKTTHLGDHRASPNESMTTKKIAAGIDDESARTNTEAAET
jgi:hypothetical protein